MSVDRSASGTYVLGRHLCLRPPVGIPHETFIDPSRATIQPRWTRAQPCNDQRTRCRRRTPRHFTTLFRNMFRLYHNCAHHQFLHHKVVNSKADMDTGNSRQLKGRWLLLDRTMDILLSEV